ncbi:MAG: FAD-dependent oxidoreductase [Candidatus Neomarinimicrobiota bacterium]
MPVEDQIIAIIGGAVAGSEAAHELSERGMRCAVIEQNDLPYGKIEDGLPKWHEKQRRKEMDLIDSRMGSDLVDFVPLTKVGKDISFEELHGMDWSAILLANGAWKDRSFPIPEVEEYEGKGFWYQNPFVYWFNHHEEPAYGGEDILILDDALVVGGGLASIDVVKILQLELVTRTLNQKGNDVTLREMEHKGIPRMLESLGVTWDELGLKGCFLLYRRDITNMPLVTIPPDAGEKKEKAIRNTRRKILNNAIEKYLFRFQDHRQPTGILMENGRLVGLRMIETDVIDRKAVPKEGTEHDVRGSMIISSIGSIPEPIEGIPMQWNWYDIESEETGEVNNLKRVFGMGNAITGKGNIRVSRVNARGITNYVLDNHLPEEGVDVVSTREKIKSMQVAAGYDGNYSKWAKAHRRG